MVSAFIFKTRQVGVFSVGNPNALKENNYHWFTLHSSVSSWHHVKSAQEILSLPSKPRAGNRAVSTWPEEDLKGEGSRGNSKEKGATVSQKGMRGQAASATGTETPACSWPSGLTQLGSASIHADLQPCSLPVLKRDPWGPVCTGKTWPPPWLQIPVCCRGLSTVNWVIQGCSNITVTITV